MIITLCMYLHVAAAATQGLFNLVGARTNDSCQLWLPGLRWLTTQTLATREANTQSMN